MPTTEYDISRAFKRIENDLIDSMMRNLKRHRAEEDELGIKWEQWQALQLKELERYRAENAEKFSGEFTDINKRINEMLNTTYNDAQTDEERKVLEHIKQRNFTPTTDEVSFFNLNDEKLNVLLERTQMDFTKAEYAVLRRANDAYRKVIFDAQVYANVTNDYNRAVDMATHDFLKNGLQSIQYKNGARHNISDYARMAIRTTNKRAYLMGEGNAHDKFGIHTVRVNRRTQACPLCVGYLGKVLIDDVYSGGTAKEASELGVPTLSSAMQAGFLHPNCKDIYSLYIDGVSQPAKPWTQQEINDIVGEYNEEQAIRHAVDMATSYARMAKYALDPLNAQKYQARADNWQARIDEIKNTPPVPVEPPVVPPIEPPLEVVFTDDEKDALEWYVSGDGMWINQYLRGNGDFGELSDSEQTLLDLLTSATSKPLEATDKLYRSVDASVIFSDLSEEELSQMMTHLYYGDSAYSKGAYSQGIKKRMETALNRAKGREITEKGFMSTTVDKRVAEEFGDFTGAENPVVIEFDTKGKKLKGADLDFLDIEEAPQRERLLTRNTRYKVNDISVEKTEDGMRYVKVKAEIIDQGEEIADAVVEEVAEQPKAFVPAKTIQEAEEYAGSLGMQASYKGVDLDVANAMNESFKRGFEFCPSIKERMKMVGSGQERNKRFKEALVDYYLHSDMVDSARALGFTEKQIQDRAKKWASRSVGKITNAYAFAHDVKQFPQFSGIFVNNKWANSEKMLKQLEHDVAQKWSPVGTVSVKAVFDHEMGHQLDYALGLRSNPDIVKLYRGMSRTEIKENLSEYATTNIKEFISEAYSEYLNNPQPRDIARQVGEIIERLASEQR